MSIFFGGALLGGAMVVGGVIALLVIFLIHFIKKLRNRGRSKKSETPVEL